MITFPSVKSTTGKGTRILIKPEQRKDWGEDKIDALKKLFGQQVLKLSRCQLNWKQFICLVIYPEISIVYIVMYMNLVFAWGSLLVFTVQLIKFLVAMPICNINILLGSYSHRSFIRVWDMAPIFKGIGWSVAIYQLFMELFNTSAAGLALIFIPHFLKRNIEWKDCKFPNATDKCYPMFPKENNTMECCSARLPDCNIYIHFSTLDYLRTRVLNLHDNSDEIVWKGINRTWSIGVCFVHVIIFAFTIPGFLRFKNMIAVTILTLTICCSIPMYILNFIVSSTYAVPRNIWSDFSALTNYKFWVQMIIYVSAAEMPGYNVLIGSYAAAGVTPDVAALSVYTVKFLILTLTANCFSAAISIVIEHYKVMNADCFHLTGHEVLFAVVPDILSRSLLPQIVGPLWFLVIALWGILSATLVITGFVDTLTDTFPKLIQYRLCTCSLVCVVGLIVNITLLHNNYFLFFRTWTRNGVIITLLILLAIYLIAIYVYSLQNIENDYHFIYGTPLKPFWVLSIKATSLVILACFALLLFQKFEFIQTRVDGYLILMRYFLMVVILAPIPIYMVYIYIKYQTTRRKISLINPTTSWGPPKAEQKHARKRFNPQREMHYKSDVTHCKHNCLLNSRKIKDEIERLNENRQKLIDAVGEETLMTVHET